MHPTRRAALAALILLALSACTRMRSAAIEEDDTDVITLNIVNHHLLNVTVFNVIQGHRDRLGEVTSASKTSFKLHLRRMAGGDLQLYADPVGATQGVTSERLHLSAGDTVEWTLETDLARSHVEIR
jgi:hypothetical protein